MKKYFRAIADAFAMFSVLPIKKRELDDQSRVLAVFFFPLVGMVIGALWALCYYALTLLISNEWFPKELASFIFVAIPFAISGFIHIGGYMNTSDAIRTSKDIDEKRRIIKSGEVGAFAVVSVLLLILLEYACASSLTFDDEDFRILFFIPIVTRCLSSLAVSVMPPIATSHYGGDYQKYVKNIEYMTVTIFGILMSFAGTMLCGLYGLALVSALVGFSTSLMRGYRKLDGMSGDIVGYALVNAEAWAIVMFALVRPFTNFLESILL